MKKGDYIQAILRSPKTVFTFKDIALLWKEVNTNAARVRLNYYVRNGDLYSIRRGIYAKSDSYERLELANRIFTPSYVSFETVLAKEGLIFQYQSQISIASYLTRSISIDNQVYSYRKIRDSILTNPIGVQHIHEQSIATKERALLDTLYIYRDYHVDNIRSLDWEMINSMVPMYENKRMESVVKKLYDNQHIDP